MNKVVFLCFFIYFSSILEVNYVYNRCLIHFY